MADFVVPEGMPRAVFEAKYSRKKPDGSFQTWAERTTEVVKGNCALHPTGADDYERLLALTKKGVIAWAGRHLQQGDLDQTNKQMEIFTNCSTAMASFIKFWLLMKGSGVGRCFVAGTKVKMADGSYKPIEEVLVGEEVLSYDEKIGKSVPKRVDQTWTNPPKPLVKVTLQSGETVTCTEDHLFLTEDGEWTEARSLQGKRIQKA